MIFKSSFAHCFINVNLHYNLLSCKVFGINVLGKKGKFSLDLFGK